MAIHENYFNAGHFLIWSWPLEVGVYDPEDKYTADFLNFQYIPKLSKINTLPLDKGYLNLMIFPEGMEQAARVMKNQRVALGAYPGVIIVLEPAISIAYTDQKKIKSYQSDLKESAEEMGLSGVFHLEYPFGPGQFLDHLLVELSHNNSLPDALKHIGAQGFYCYDKKLIKETKLSHVVTGLVKALNAFIPDRNLYLESFLLSGENNFSGRSLAAYLKKQAPSFVYDSERGEATGIAQITESLYRELAQPIFNLGNKNFQWAMSPPPQSMPESAGPEEMAEFEESEMSPTPAPPTHGGDHDGESFAESGDGDADGWVERPSSRPAAPPKNKVKKPKKTPHSPLYLQARLVSSATPDVAIKNYLRPRKSYILTMRIGMPDSGWLQGAATFPSDVVFEHSKAVEELLLITYTDNFSDKVQSASLMLRLGDNTGEVIFKVKTAKAGIALEGHIAAYHQNRLIQEGVIRAGVYSENKLPDNYAPVAFDIVACIRKQLDNADERIPFGTSLQMDTDGADKGNFKGVSNNKPLELHYTTGLANLISEIKAEIENAVVNLDDFPEDLFAENNVNLLHFLAYKGNDLYVNFLNANPDLKGPIQLVSNREEFLPLDFVYTLPPPSEQATLCEHAKAALIEGACKNCYDKRLDPAPCFCPFGFWGFSEIIERHKKDYNGSRTPADFNLLAEPSSGRNTLNLLNTTLFAASARVEVAQPGLLQVVSHSIEQNTSVLKEAVDWDQWDAGVGDSPDSLILVVHIEKHAVLKVEQLEIGDKKFLVKNLLNRTKIIGSKSTKPPFVVIIGCEANNLSNHGFDIAAQLMNQGAAIVLSNFTKIRGRQAGPIVMRLVEFIKGFRGKEIRFGEIVLKLRQHLLSEGVMAGLSLVAYGDADWKINV